MRQKSTMSKAPILLVNPLHYLVTIATRYTMNTTKELPEQLCSILNWCAHSVPVILAEPVGYSMHQIGNICLQVRY